MLTNKILNSKNLSFTSNNLIVITYVHKGNVREPPQTRSKHALTKDDSQRHSKRNKVPAIGSIKNEKLNYDRE